MGLDGLVQPELVAQGERQPRPGRRVVGLLLDDYPGGCFGLFIALSEDSGSVLGAGVIVLAIQGRGVVGAKEYVKKIFVAYFFGIVCELNNFGVPCITG